MEKEKLSQNLSALVGENSLSERTWNDYLENSVIPFLPNDEESKGDFLNKQANVLKSLNGQLNHEVATRVNEFKKNYKPENTAKPDNEPTQPPIDNEKLTDLEARLNRFEEAEAAKKRS